jgi:hypothetical protein
MHASRLTQVRPGLLERRQALGELANPGAGESAAILAEDCGFGSLADSTDTRTSRASRSSSRTYRSSKNRRKHERKMCSIKEGSLYEDLGLVRALHQIVLQTYELRGTLIFMSSYAQLTLMIAIIQISKPLS